MMKSKIMVLAVLSLLIMPTLALSYGYVYGCGTFDFANTSQPYLLNQFTGIGEPYTYLLAFRSMPNTAAANVTIRGTQIYGNGTTEVFVYENQTDVSGIQADVTYTTIAQPASDINVTFDLLDGNATGIKYCISYPITIEEAAPDVDELTGAIVGLVTWTQNLLDDVIAPVLNTFILLWTYLLQWVVVLLAMAWSIKAVFLGYHMIADGGKNQGVKRGR